MDISREADNKNCTMNSLQMLVSLIETAIKERTLDKLYGDFLEEALKLGLSSYTLNILIVNTKKKIEDSNDDSDDDLILPFIYRPDIIKQDPEIKVQDKQVVRNKKGYGFIISLVIVLLMDVGIIAMCCHRAQIDSRDTHKSLDSLETKMDKIKSIAQIDNAPVYSFDPWTSTNNQNNTKSNKDYSFTIQRGDKLSFDYDVSTELGYDELNVYLYANSDTLRLLTESGIASGTNTHIFDNSGDVTVRFEYSKDDSYSKDKDVVEISNINVYRPYNVQINEIKRILNDD